jgi:hypothetical protein
MVFVLTALTLMFLAQRKSIIYIRGVDGKLVLALMVGLLKFWHNEKSGA